MSALTTKRSIALLSLVLLSLPSFGQRRFFTGFQSPNIDPSVYTAMQNIWYANERPSYLSIAPVFNSQIAPVIPFREGEGKQSLHIMEANINARTPIAMGRNHGNSFWQTSRLTFDAGFNVRMASDSSSPLLPNNNVVGLSIDKVLWNSITRGAIRRGNLDYSFTDWNALEQPLHNISLNLSVHHYSNGQPPGFFLKDTVNSVVRVRNDYRKGDFSTNYVRAGLTYSFLSSKRNLFSANLTYRWDGTIGGPLVYSEEQKRAYGHHRLEGFLQYRVLLEGRQSDKTVQDICEGDTIRRKLQYFHEFFIRWEPSIILDDISQAHTPDGKSHRFGQHLFLGYTRPNWRSFGFIIHLYSGRDYSNIRYDLPIFAAMGGVYINFNKYYPALSDRRRFADAVSIH